MSEATEAGNVFVANYPPFSAWRPEHVAAALSALDSPPRPATRLGLYLHIPFCRRRCKFCYFRVYTDKDGRQIGRYLDALASEVRLVAERPAVAGRPLSFVYFGGGTPSYISVDHLHKLVAEIRSALPWSGVEEVTFECEPGTLTLPKLEAIRAIGVSRLSLGIESFDDRILAANGRAHLGEEIARVRPWIRDLDFDQLNVDLIAGMLGETWESWRETVRATLDYDPDSVTIYQMELPFNTTFVAEMKQGSLAESVPDWEMKRALHDWAFAELEAAGYEISSAYTMVKKAARAGRKAGFVYRDTVWDGGDLLGTGVASFSHLSGVHFQNTDSWDDYLERLEAGRLPLSRALVTSARERLVRELILKLKLGCLRSETFRRKFGVDPLSEFAGAFGRLEEQGMAIVQEDAVTLTRQGLMRVDSLLPEFYEDRFRDRRYT